MTEEFFDENTKKAMLSFSQDVKQIQKHIANSLPKVNSDMFKSAVDLANIRQIQIELGDKIKEQQGENKLSPWLDVTKPDLDFTKLKNHLELPENFVTMEAVMVELQKEMNESLKQIADNTSVLNQLIEIAQDTSGDTKEQKIIMHEMLDILSSETEDEANEKFQKVVGKISSLGSHASNFGTLINLANMFYQSFINK